jgi:pimeloyl-ACP methyl ester carboxylesterase
MTHDLIVFIPGIGGSRLERDGKLVYDLSIGGLPKLLMSSSREKLQYKGSYDEPPNDGIVATDLINFQLIPGLFGVDDYDGLCKTLSQSVKNPSRQFIKFPYDWRASNRWAAEKLDVMIRPVLEQWRQDSGAADAKLWLVCHSMGGLVARYFLEHLGGKAITRNLVTIGTPHRGAPKALDALVNGKSFLWSDFSEVIRSFPSVYELLPQGAMIRIGRDEQSPLARLEDFFGLSGSLPLPASLGLPATPPSGLEALPNLNPEWIKQSLAFHAAIRQPVIDRLRTGEHAPYNMRCVMNRRQATVQSAVWEHGQLIPLETSPSPLPPGQDPLLMRGDGTVPAFSSIPIEFADTSTAIVVDEMHVKLPAAQGVRDIIHNFVDPVGAGLQFMSGQDNGAIGLSFPPVVLANQSFPVTLDAIRAANVKLIARNLATTDEHILYKHLSDRTAAIVELTLPAGSYELTAKSATDLSRPSISNYLFALG